MRKLILSLAAGILGLAVTGSAEARDARHYDGRPSNGQAYYQTHGRSFSGGYYYQGRHHDHWSRRVWDSGNNRYQYWGPYLNCYYYWYAPRHCYYPVTYHP